MSEQNIYGGILSFFFVHSCNVSLTCNSNANPFMVECPLTIARREPTNTDAKTRYREMQTSILLRGLGQILLESTLELLLLGRRLESTVTELRRGVDPFQLHLLESLSRGVREQGLPQGHDSLLDTRDGSLDHDEVVVDLAISDEATQTR